MMDLPDGGLLGHQLPLPAPQLRHVPEQDQRTHVSTGRPQRDGSQEQRRLTVLDLRLTSRPAGQHRGQHVVDGLQALDQVAGDIAEPAADQVGHQPHPAVCGQRVRAGERHHSVPIDPDAAVPDPGRGGQQPLATVREDALADHPRQIRRALQVGQLQPAGRADAEQVGVARDHGDDLVPAPDRDGLDPHRYVVAPLGVALPADPPPVVRLVQQRPPVPRDEAADDVVQVRRGAGRRAHLGAGPEAETLGVGQPQHQIREGQIGEHLPVGHDQLQPVQVRLAQRRVMAHHICQRRHRFERSGWTSGRPALSRSGRKFC